MVLITGGAGFIGSNLVHYWMRTTNDIVINVDNLTYAGNPQNLDEISEDPRYVFLRTDICLGNIQLVASPEVQEFLQQQVSAQKAEPKKWWEFWK